jgi:hypothetical protein
MGLHVLFGKRLVSICRQHGCTKPQKEPPYRPKLIASTKLSAAHGPNDEGSYGPCNFL